MKRVWMPMIIATLAVALLCGCARTSYTEPAYGYAPPPENVDVGYFYDALAPYGDWIQSDAYGLVWSPSDKPVDWRPYTDGEWVWTDEGWTWVADEDWGWGPYHYGRWYDDANYGWCWVPGQEWGPAWVAWREGDGWVGWAPMPPEVVWHVGVGFDWGNWDNMPGVQHYWWSFTRERDLPGPGVQRRIEPRHRAVVLVQDTRNVTNYTFVNSHVVNRSVDLAPIRQAYGRDIPARRVADLPAPPANHGRQLAKGTLNAYRPQMREAPAGRAPQTVHPARPAAAPDVVPVNLPVTPRTPQVDRGARAQQSREAIALQGRQNAERKRLQQEVSQETKRPPAGVKPEQLRAQHEQQQKALTEQTARDQRVFQARQNLRPQGERKAPAAKQPPAKQAPNKKPKPTTNERGGQADRTK